MYQHYRLARSRYIIHKLISVQLESSPGWKLAALSQTPEHSSRLGLQPFTALFTRSALFHEWYLWSGLENVRWIINVKDPNTPCTLTTFTLLKDQRDVTFVLTTSEIVFHVLQIILLYYKTTFTWYSIRLLLEICSRKCFESYYHIY